jgi:holo-[acyl-carrier protein] synthase
MLGDCKKQGTSLCGEFMSEWNIGVDIVEIARFQQLDYPSNKQFYTRVFTPNEIKYCLSFSNPAPHFAANFAGKEAVYKAVNIFCEVNLKNIEILRNENGSPIVKLHLRSEQKFDSLQVKVSLSHSVSHAIAFALVHNPDESANSNRKAEARSPHEL